jgi:hypothetical protein
VKLSNEVVTATSAGTKESARRRQSRPKIAYAIPGNPVMRRVRVELAKGLQTPTVVRRSVSTNSLLAKPRWCLLVFFGQFDAQKPSLCHPSPDALSLGILRHFRHAIAVDSVVPKFRCGVHQLTFGFTRCNRAAAGWCPGPGRLFDPGITLRRKKTSLVISHRRAQVLCSGVRNEHGDWRIQIL